MARLSISCLGPFQVTLDGQPLTRFKSNKVRALLIFLAVEADRPHRREVLAGLLWPDWPDRDALSNLRYALSNLRLVIGDRARAESRDADPPFLLIARDTLQFNTASDYSLDVTSFEHLSSFDDLSSLREAVALYRCSFLEGFSVGDSPAFEEWALFTRERLARKMSSALHDLAAIHEQHGEYEDAQTFAQKQLALEPWDETAHQQLMRALALSGERSAALAQYETCRRLLAEELGVEPAPETTRLYERIRDGEFVPGAATHVHPLDLVVERPLFLDVEEPVKAEQSPFVARERELAQLDGYLDAALAGQGRVVFVIGEVGSGKTSLIQEYTWRAQQAHADLVVASGNCNAQTGIGDPYLPFREILELLTGDVQARWAAGAMSGEQARRLWSTLPLAVEALVEAGPNLLDTLVPRAALLERARACIQWPGRTDWLTRLDQRSEAQGTTDAGTIGPQQSDLFEQYSKVLQALAQHRPMLLVLDDLQWADLGSISLLFHLGRQLAGSPILIVGAYRPEELAFGRPASAQSARGIEAGRERHPLEPVVHEFQRLFGDITVDVGQAESRVFVGALLDSEPNRLGASFREMLFRQTRGHPLFTVELIRGLQEQGALIQDSKGRWVEGPALDWERLPARVEAVIAERIGRLAQPLQAALRVASVEGETFTAEIIARALTSSETEIVGRLSRELDRRHRLVRAQGILRVDGRRVSQYRFRHILFQKYVYNSLDEVEKSYLHEAVGDTIEALYEGQTETMATIAGRLAWHFREAGLPEKAIGYLCQAGERAVQLSAYQEAIAHLTQGLGLLAALPDAVDEGRRLELARQELALQLALGVAWIGIGSASPKVGVAFARARELSRQLGETSQLCKVLGELSIFHYVRAEHRRARELAEESLGLAQQAEDPLLEAFENWHLGFVLFALGEFTAARDHLERTVAFYDPQKHHKPFVSSWRSDAGVAALAYNACCLWCLGYPEHAVRQSQEALSVARELGHAFSLADVLSFGACMFNAMRREPQALKEHAEELIRLATESSFPGWFASGTVSRGEALAQLGQVHDGIALMRQGAAAMQSRGGIRCYLSEALCAQAEAQAKAGQPEEGLATVARALALVEETDERLWEAEIHRVHAELLLLKGAATEAEASLHRAIAVARHQNAKSWELRATVSLCRLLQQRGKIEKARQMLADVYGWFTEGFNEPDLLEATALLEELS